MGRSPLPALLLAALAAGCGSTGAALRRLEALHDPRDFSHRPDTPASANACHAEVLRLGDADFGDPRDAAGAILLLSRVATEDGAALHRLEGCRALGRLGGIVAPSGDLPAGVPPTEDATAAALAEVGRTRDPALFRAVGRFRIPLPADPGPAGLGRELRILSGFLAGVLREAGDEEETAGALRNLGSGVIRVALAGTVLHDGDPRVRSEAARALGAFAGADLADLLRTAYGAERDGPARRAVVRAEAAVAGRSSGAGRDPALSVLVAALDDDDRGIRFEAREALRTLAGEDLGEKSAPWIRWWDATRAGP